MSCRIIFWNSQKGSATKINAIVNLSPSILVLVETKLTLNTITTLSTQGFRFHCNKNISILVKSIPIIETTIDLPGILGIVIGTQPIEIIGVHLHNDPIARRSQLEAIKHHIQRTLHPMIILGDLLHFLIDFT